MSSGCGDVLSLEDLKTAKKHQIFEAEVITGKSGGVAGGADIDYATNQVTGQVQKTMPAILRDIGFEPASFDFTTGGTLGVNDRNKVVYDPVSKTWYSWAGALPKVIAAGTNPVGDVNWVPRTDPNLRSDLSDTTNSAFGDALIGVRQPFTGAVARTQHDKNKDVINARDFGAVGDWNTTTETGTLATTALQSALDYAFSLGGAEVVVPEGVFGIDSPLIVKSGVHLRGSGRNTIIYNVQSLSVTFPKTNCIHIGYSKEWGPNGGASPSTPDTTLGQLLANNFTNITTRNASVTNLTVQAKGKGLGVWALNAMNTTIRDIWSIDTTTPVNVANDDPSVEAGCVNTTVDNIFQVSGNGDWYDLFFAGHAVNTNVSRLYNNPLTKSLLAEMVVFNGSVGFCLSDCQLIGNETGATQQTVSTVLISGSNLARGIVKGCTFAKTTNAVSCNALGGVIVSSNNFYNTYTPVQLNSSGNIIDGNLFENNVIDVAGNNNGINNKITNNFGLRNSVLAGWPVPALVNHYANNDRKDTNLNNNYNTYAGLRGRKIAFFPLDAWLNTADTAVTNNTGAVISRNSTGAFTLYYKIPESVKKFANLKVNCFAAGTGGDVINVNIVGIDSDNNTNTLPLFQAMGTKTTVAGDQTLDYGESNFMFAAGTYYIQIVSTMANTGTQLRNLMIQALCED